MKKVLVIAGPTASGKTSFSIELAKELKTEIISGDSIQVYKGLDIGSGKITEEEKKGIKHYLIDILDSKEQYSVADFQKEARKIIDDMNTVPLIVGGTGLYLKACLYDYVFTDDGEDRVDPSLEKYSNEELHAMLEKVDPIQAEKIHTNNRQRLLRSLTIFKMTGTPQSEHELNQQHEMIYDAFIACCTSEREVLYDRINKRVHRMIEQGLKEEVESLLHKGVTFQDPCMKGIGYREWKRYFEEECSIQEVEEEIARNSRRYAKRQYTWLNHQFPVHWFDPYNEVERKQMMGEMIRFAKENENE